MAQTDRLRLPLLAAAQAQKEMTHNEALAALDSIVQPVVVSVAPATIPSHPLAGQSWIVGVGATEDWTGQDGALATLTAGGWRFAAPFDGMAVWSLADGMPVRRRSGVWEIGHVTATEIFVGGDRVVGPRLPAIGDPVGGSTVDAEARSTIAAIADALRTHGLIEI